MNTESHIFLSYRRGDTAGHVGRLYEELQQRYLAGTVFMDIDGIAPGQDFVAVLDKRLEDATIVLVLIGPRWFGTNDDGTRRIDDAKDFVHMEVAAALARSGTTVIPVLCGGATMPSDAMLPASLAALARRNAFELSDLRWRVDVQRLFRAIDGLLRSVATEPKRMPKLAIAAVVIVGLLWFSLRTPAVSGGLSTEIPKPMKVAELPTKLVRDAKEQLARAQRKWSSDAYPWNVEIDCDGNSDGRCDTKITFESEAKQIGLFASRTNDSDEWTYSQYGTSRNNEKLSLDLMELDDAIAKARSYGMKGRVSIARIEMHRGSDGHNVPYWLIFPGDGGSAGNGDHGFCLDGRSGARVNCYRLGDH